MLILILVGYLFRKLAFDKNRNVYLWVILAVVTWFAAQFIGGIVAALLMGEQVLEEDSALYVIGFTSSILGVSILYMVLYSLPALDDEEPNNDPNILDGM
jgi:hypothetical protein